MGLCKGKCRYLFCCLLLPEILACVQLTESNWSGVETLYYVEFGMQHE
jgi:hypothetical protein